MTIANTTKHTIWLLLVGVALALCLPQAAFADNLQSAKVDLGVGSSNTIEVTPNDDLKTVLKDAGAQATASNPMIVHANAGTYTVATSGTSEFVTVPANVIFVADAKATFNATGTGSYMMVMRGSMYGGTYNQNSVQTGIFCYKQQYTGKNGIVSKVTVNSNNKGNSAIMAYDGTTGLVVKNCTINGGKNGVKASEKSTIKAVQNNTIKNCGANKGGSGIEIIESNVTTISGNTISGCIGHGISTGTNAAKKTTCNIGSITNNVIKNNKTQGIYIEGNSHVTKTISGNTITGNTGAGIAMRSNVHNVNDTYSTQHFPTYAKAVKNNKIYANKGSNISVTGKKATLYLGAGNSVYSSKTSCGLSLTESAQCMINGAKNKFYGNKTAGAIISSKAKLTIKGANTTFNSNKAHGISVNAATVILKGKGCTFNKNTKLGISLTANSKFTATGKNMQASNNKVNGVNMTGKNVVFSSTGTGAAIAKNGKNGFSINGKGKATIKNMKFNGNKKFAVYVGKGCKCTYSKTNLSPDKNAKNRIYIV